MDNVIVTGAGLAGLSCAYELCKRGKKVMVIEKHPAVGGLARSFYRKGFFCDIGPHRFHTEKKEILDHILEVTDGNLVKTVRETRIFLMDRFFDYPLKMGNVLVHMPKIKILKIFYHYMLTRLKVMLHTSPDDSFEDWVVNRFGKELYNIFFKEYTEKTWGMPCSEISSDWAAQRISLLNLWDTIRSTIWRSSHTPRTFVSKFYYPKTGGIGYISECYASKIKEMGGKILLNTKIQKMVQESGMITKVELLDLETGETKVEQYDHVFSTISMCELIKIIDPPVPDNVLESAHKLLFNSVLFIYLLLDKPRLSTNQWIYIPEKKLINNRVTEFKNFNPDGVPPDKTMICAEVTCRVDSEIWNITDDDLVMRVVHDLKTLDLLKDANVLDSHVVRMKEAYPIYDLHYREKVKSLHDYLGKIPNISYFGRNAMFRYNNMDHSIDMGLTAAQSVESKKSFEKIATDKRYFG